MRLIFPALLLCSSLLAEIRFRPQEIQTKFGVVYAVLTADINGDGKPDIVAINPTQVVWYENPSWEKHVILDGVSKKDNVAIAAADIDGDGKIDLVVGTWLGRLRVYRNQGTNARPEYAKPKWLDETVPSANVAGVQG